MEREIDRFTAVTESGLSYKIVAYQEFIRVSAMSSPESWIPGMKRLELANGSSPVNRIDDSTFKIVLTNEIVRKL